jgi:hypothetical protein
VFEFCSGLVDLVVGVRHHRGGGHRLTLTGERCGFSSSDFVALSNKKHIEEVGMTPPTEPEVFLKATTSLTEIGDAAL